MMQFSGSLHFPVYTYGILMLLAFLAGIGLFSANCRAAGTRTPDLTDILLVISLCGIAGARLLYIMLFPHQFNSIRDYLALHEGGLVFYGGLIAAIIGLFAYLRLKKAAWTPVFDCLVPSLALGQAIGRFGCLFNECCYGTRTTLLHIYRISSDPPECFRHPTQAYEAAFLAVMAIATALLLRCQKGSFLRPGMLSGMYLLAYSCWRFLLEFLRGDERGGFFTALHLSPSQLVSIILMAISTGMIVYCYKYSSGFGDNKNEQN